MANLTFILAVAQVMLVITSAVPTPLVIWHGMGKCIAISKFCYLFGIVQCLKVFIT